MLQRFRFAQQLTQQQKLFGVGNRRMYIFSSQKNENNKQEEDKYEKIAREEREKRQQQDEENKSKLTVQDYFMRFTLLAFVITTTAVVLDNGKNFGAHMLCPFSKKPSSEKKQSCEHNNNKE